MKKILSLKIPIVSVSNSFAQVGLVDPTGGFLVLLCIGVLAVIGFLICIISVIRFIHSPVSRYKKFLFFFLGLVLVAPALWLTFVLFAPEIPRTKSWDLRSSRSVSQLETKPVRESYYYQGNIRSTVQLPSNKQWSGNAHLVIFRAKRGQITEIHWQSKPTNTDQIYHQTKQILEDLGMQNYTLDPWYTRVRGGEQASFATATGPDSSPQIEVQVRGSFWGEEAEKISWIVHVNVWWNEGDS